MDMLRSDYHAAKAWTLHIQISFNRKRVGFNKHEWKQLTAHHSSGNVLGQTNMSHDVGRSAEKRRTNTKTKGSDAEIGGLLLSTSSLICDHVTFDLPVLFLKFTMAVKTLRATWSSPSGFATCCVALPEPQRWPWSRSHPFNWWRGQSSDLSFLKRCVSDGIAIVFQNTLDISAAKTKVARCSVIQTCICKNKNYVYVTVHTAPKNKTNNTV